MARWQVVKRDVAGAVRLCMAPTSKAFGASRKPGAVHYPATPALARHGRDATMGAQSAVVARGEQRGGLREQREGHDATHAWEGTDN